MDFLPQEIRIALRRLLRQPGFTTTVVLTLALGIGASTSLFSVLDALLIRPLPYSEPDRLALLWEVFPDSGFSQIPSGEINWPVWQEEFDSLERLASFKLSYRNLSSPGPPRRLTSWEISPNLFDTLGVTAQLGGTFQRENGRPGAEPVVLLSESLWRSRFGSDLNLINRPIWLDGTAHRVVGVLGKGVFFPPPLRILGGTHELAGEIFIPAQLDPNSPDPRRNLALIARLAPGKTWTQAALEVEQRATRAAQVYPEYNPADLSATLVPVHSQAVADSRPVLLLASISVGLVLLLACINVANLLLAKGLSHLRESAIRAALGAGRFRILRQLMMENLILALLGGAAGSLLALWSLDTLASLISSRIPQVGIIEFSGRVWLFGWGITLLTAILFGLLPALRISNSKQQFGYLSSRQGSSSIRPTLRTVLVISEVALATVLLLVAGLMLQSFWKLQQVELGFEPSGVLSFTIQPSENRYPQPHQQQQLIRDLMGSVRGSQAVTAVGAISGLPLSGDREGIPVEIEGRPTATLDQRLAAMTALRFITPGYFSTLKITVLAGRDIEITDRENSPPVVIVDRSFVQRFLPGTPAVGSRITFDDDQDPNAVWREIVGVVEGVKQESLDRQAQFVGSVYIPHAQMAQPGMSLVVRSSLPEEAAVREVLERIRAVDGELAAEVAPVEDLVDQALDSYRAPTILLSSLASAAFLLAIVGLYGVISFIVASRKREIGVRMALGATSGRIFRLIMSQTSRWTAAGILLGISIAAAANQILSSQLFEVSGLDIYTHGVVTAIFLTVTFLATWIPALRASRVDPSSVLRED